MSYCKMCRRDERQGSPVHKRPRTNKALVKKISATGQITYGM